MAVGSQFAELTFGRLLAGGKICESERTTFYLGFAAGIGWATEMIDSRFVTTQQLEKQS